METEQESLQRKLEEAKQAALDIEEGRKSRYWRLLEKKIKSWLEAEKKKLDIANQRLIRSDEEIESRNDIVKRIALLTQFSAINEDILDEKLGVIGIVNSPIPERLMKKTTFVSRKATNTQNGR